MLRCGKTGHVAKACDHRVRTVNEVTMTAPVSTPVSVVTEPGHSLRHVYSQSTSVRHDWIRALNVDIHSCSHYKASNMKPMVDSGAAIYVRPSWYGFSSRCASAKQQSLKSAGGDVLHHLGSKVESYVNRSLKFQVGYEVAPVVRPTLLVDLLSSKEVLVVFGIEGTVRSSGCLTDRKIPMIRENGAMELDATLVDRRNMVCDLVVPFAVPVASETHDEEM